MFLPPWTTPGAIYEILAVNGTIPVDDPTILTLGSVFSSPLGVAVDGSGNVFVADSGNNAMYEMVAVNGSVPAKNPEILTLATGLASPLFVAVDGSGNVYSGDGVNDVVELNLAHAPSLNFAATPVGGDQQRQPSIGDHSKRGQTRR